MVLQGQHLNMTANINLAQLAHYQSIHYQLSLNPSVCLHWQAIASYSYRRVQIRCGLNKRRPHRL